MNGLKSLRWVCGILLFFDSNTLTAGIWNRLEQHVRQLADKSDIVFVCSGPLFLPAPISTSNELTVPTTAQMTSQSQPNELWVQYRVIGDSHVAVPTHFFKVVLSFKQNQLPLLQAYVVPNESGLEKEKLSKFLVPIDLIEKASGYMFFGHARRPSK
eukprot:m.693499 g.693499  ORF g.693499 m.693499 type:complete len:157 (-) comp22873_c0_seq3:137-607(-)